MPTIYPIDNRLTAMIDRLFLIPNLVFRKYIGFPPTRDNIKIHNSIADEYGLEKIDPVELVYIKKDNPKYKDIN